MLKIQLSFKCYVNEPTQRTEKIFSDLSFVLKKVYRHSYAHPCLEQTLVFCMPIEFFKRIKKVLMWTLS